MQTSGLILDMHDDYSGEVIREIYPSLGDVPEIVKTAQKLSQEDLDSLPDDVFALVLQQGDTTLRKYACVDEGNTILNVEYFLKTAHKLPKEAQKVAARNLLTACDWYNIEPPEELKKIAFIGALVSKIPMAANLVSKIPAALNIANKVSTGIEAAKAGTEAIKGLKSNSSTIQNVFKAASVKQADLTFTETMPAASSSVRTPEKKKAVITKSGAATQQYGSEERGPHAMGHLVRRRQEDANYPQVNAPPAKPKPLSSEGDWDYQLTEGEPSGRQFTGRVMSPNIEVRGKDGPERPVYEKRASKYALNGRYPLDNLVQIKRAAAYFDEYGPRMTPVERHTYCVNMVKAASAIGIEVSEEAIKYGSEDYAPDDEIKLAMDVRKSALLDDRHHAVLDMLLEKRASMHPDVFCQALSLFDRNTGLHHYYDQYIPDPYWSTYGVEKTAAFVENIAGETVTEEQLRNLASPGGGTGSAWALLRKTFGDEFADEFHKDPVGIFKSLPRDQKIYIMRLATDNSPSGMGA